jgi:hypothetical protein
MSFVYEPLPQPELEGHGDSFRLLYLQPGHGQDPVCCSIKTHQVANAPPYETISYCWGDITQKGCIQCGDSTLEVTTTIIDALRHLRRSEGLPRLLWIDQICIDQQDLRERSYQVSMMRLIYYSADRTIVWLGVADNKTEMAFHSVTRLAQVRANLIESKVEYVRIPNNEPLLKQYGLPEVTDQDKELSAFVYLLQQPWFERVWVIQEVAVSKSTIVVQGRFETSWKDFAAAVYLLSELRLTPTLNSLDTHMEHVVFTEGVRGSVESGQFIKLRFLIVLFRYAKATDARDKIYGILGLSDDFLSLAKAPAISYEHSVSDTYRLWTIYMIRSEKTLEVLSMVNRYKSSGAGIEYSWVPDWNTTEESLSNHHLSAWPSECFQATASSEMDVKFRDSETVLGLQGHVLDRIEAVGAILSNKAGDTIFGSENCAVVYTLNRILISWEATTRFGKIPLYAPTGETMRDAFWQTVSFGEDGYGPDEKERGKADFEDFFAGFRKPLLLSERFQTYRSRHLWIMFWVIALIFRSLFSRAKPRSIQPFTVRCEQMGWRRVIRTQSGYIGLAVHCAEVGDHVALFKGSRMPLVVRQDSDEWRLIGDTYVHGIMHGEAWQEDHCTTFWIR